MVFCDKNSKALNGKGIYRAHRGYFTKIGILSFGLKVKALRREGKFYVTNRLNFSSKQIITMYSSRSMIEEIFKVLKQECQWNRCQLRQYNAYENYYSIGILSFMCLERMRLDGLCHSIYDLC